MRSFDEAPFIVIWELTQACDLACVHCRACAIESRSPLELSTEEGFRLLEEVRSFGDPLMVFTGGDPLKRPDLLPLIEKSVRLGLRTTVTPSATPLLTEGAIERFRDCGLARMAISLDGPDSESHDGFRRVNGSFNCTILALEHAQRIGLQTQVNTTVTRHNVGRLGEIARLVERVGAKLWSVFSLVATGRASASQDLTAEGYEEVFAFLYNLSKTAPFDIKTTEAQHYRRYVAQSRKADSEGGGAARRTAPEIIQRQAGINDGKGFVFVSHTGEIYPSLAKLVVSCHSLQGTSDATRLQRCTANHPSSGHSAMPTICKESAVNANTVTCAVVPDRVRMRSRGIRWPKSRGASINRSRWATLFLAIGARNRQGSRLSGTTHLSSSYTP